MKIIHILANYFVNVFNKPQVLNVFVRKQKFQGSKNTNQEKNLKNLLSDKYHIFSNLLSKKNRDKLSLDPKYDSQIIMKRK